MVPGSGWGQALAAVQLATVEGKEQTERMSIPSQFGVKGRDGEPGRIAPGFVGTLPQGAWHKLVPAD